MRGQSGKEIYKYDSKTYQFVCSYKTIYQAAQATGVSLDALYKLSRLKPDGYRIGGNIFSVKDHGDYITQDIISKYDLSCLSRKTRREAAVNNKGVKLYMYDAETYALLDTYNCISDAAEDNCISRSFLTNTTHDKPQGHKYKQAIFSRRYYGEVMPKSIVKLHEFDKNKRMTEDEIQYIKDRLSKQPICRIAKELGRHKTTIMRRIKQMKEDGEIK